MNDVQKNSKAAPPAGPGAADRRESLRARMVEIAAEIIETEGLDGLNARRVASAAGCAVGTIYNLFDGLDGLIIAANERTLAAFHAASRAALDAALEEGAEAGERMAALARAYLGFAREHRLAWRALFDHRPAASAAMPEWYVARLNGLFDMVEEAIAPLFHAHEARERRRQARALWAATHGVVWLGLTKKLGLVADEPVGALVDSLIETQAAGLRARSHALD